MTKGTFTQKDYDRLLKEIRNFHETNAIVSAVYAVKLIIKGILTHKLELKLK